MLKQAKTLPHLAPRFAPVVACLLAESPLGSSDTPSDGAYPRSLKTTIALFADPDAAPETSEGTNGITESSG